MALTIYGFHEHPHDFAVTKIDAPIEVCAFLLDFRRPLRRVRWFGVVNEWIGPTIGLGVPVVHVGEQSGGFIVTVQRGEPYFVDLPKFWKEHRHARRGVFTDEAGGLDVIRDFATHFPEDVPDPSAS